jgi:UPF0042 nucleotide-binding protein
VSKESVLVIVTGLSGAGNSTALHALADAGMYCIDNLPMELLEPTIQLFESGRIKAPHGLALCMDIRNPHFAGTFPALKKKLMDRIGLDVIFLKATDQSIATRFSTTRRKHPLLESGESLVEAIERERDLLSPVEEASDLVLDTSTWSPQQLSKILETRYSNLVIGRQLHIVITSFGFKYGASDQSDMMFDLRFLTNPFFVPALRKKSGLDVEVKNYLFSQEKTQIILKKIEDMLRFLIPLYYEEGRHYLRIGIGCTGGRHRSVCLAEALGSSFLTNSVPNTIVTIIHRDIDRA